MEVERPTYTLRLVRPGTDRLGLMRLIRSLRPDLRPADAKAMVDRTQPIIQTDIAHHDVESIRRQFREIGAAVVFVDYFGRER